ncbi:MAG: hypothetical protein ACKOIZ_07540, partial [Actinomycetota bacterium]
CIEPALSKLKLTSVNASADATKSAGATVQPIQSGRVGHYGALLFATAAVAALVCVILNT